MISFIFCTLYAVFFGGLISYLNVVNGNPANLSLRGRRTVFITAIIFGFVIYYFVNHFYIDCDLRTGAESACHITWLN